ncbi:hypothetical protein SRB5_15820 [Streptomyces sp. RB5]|uniref:Uncharacterized protein n=1 Tax=Streptomyces smaragdinus TaxID=2585196 RepID=A0A7K0CFE4_9ACTN|nr:hypothetical protein [Streptomyces smaragdinus]MQY11464.1 hypothetical protein [Streptomyces smaragdinus]
MALIQPPLMVNGAVHSARIMRMMARNLASANQGIVEGNDLKARQMPTPGAGVAIGDGAAIVTGATSASQGSYTLFNVGAANVPIAATGASARSDLVILRVQDPEYEGTRDPAADDIGFFEVIPGVSSTTTKPPAGYTAIPLARVAIPANTATITDSMITDLRVIANPRRERRLHTAFPATLSSYTYSDNLYRNWPSQAAWQIPIPVWATYAKAVVTIAGLRESNGDTFGYMQTVLGTDKGEDTCIDDDQGNYIRRRTVVIADNIPVSAAQRGTTQTLRIQTRLRSETGDIHVDGGTSLICDIEFTEGLI